MLGQEYELLPRPLPPLEGLAGRGAGSTDSSTDGKWSCRAVGSSSAAAGRRDGGDGNALEPAVDIPLRESSGLLWMWPDPSPEGVRPVVSWQLQLGVALLSCSRVGSRALRARSGRLRVG